MRPSMLSQSLQNSPHYNTKTALHNMSFKNDNTSCENLAQSVQNKYPPKEVNDFLTCFNKFKSSEIDAAQFRKMTLSQFHADRELLSEINNFLSDYPSDDDDKEPSGKRQKNPSDDDEDEEYKDEDEDEEPLSKKMRLLSGKSLPKKHLPKSRNCSVEGCTTQIVKGKACAAHQCNEEDCTNKATEEGGTCSKHGGKRKYKRKNQCSSEGCPNQAVSGGVRGRHEANQDRCCHEGCNNNIIQGGVCKKHWAKVKRKLCSSEGCPNQAVSGGVCGKHGAQVKLCSSEGCPNQAKKGGVCVKHGAETSKLML